MRSCLNILQTDMNSKWRGIKTIQKRINEKAPKTIINRLGQKSISLPRIDDKKRWAGYPGLAGTARKIAKMIPSPCIRYVEPFAGTAKVYQEALKRKDFRIQTTILNDKSQFVCNWLRKEFPSTYVFNEDFADCIEHWDDELTFFLIDEPWNKSYYLQNFSCFNRKSVKEYDEEIIKLCKNMEGKFIITTRKENQRMLKSGFKNKLVKSEYVVSGKYPEVLITTNV